MSYNNSHDREHTVVEALSTDTWYSSGAPYNKTANNVVASVYTVQLEIWGLSCVWETTALSWSINEHMCGSDQSSCMPSHVRRSTSLWFSVKLMWTISLITCLWCLFWSLRRLLVLQFFRPLTKKFSKPFATSSCFLYNNSFRSTVLSTSITAATSLIQGVGSGLPFLLFILSFFYIMEESSKTSRLLVVCKRSSI